MIPGLHYTKRLIRADDTGALPGREISFSSLRIPKAAPAAEISALMIKYSLRSSSLSLYISF